MPAAAAAAVEASCLSAVASWLRIASCCYYYSHLQHRNLPRPNVMRTIHLGQAAAVAYLVVAVAVAVAEEEPHIVVAAVAAEELPSWNLEAVPFPAVFGTVAVAVAVAVADTRSIAVVVVAVAVAPGSKSGIAEHRTQPHGNS